MGVYYYESQLQNRELFILDILGDIQLSYLSLSFNLQSNEIKIFFGHHLLESF